jgi:hypothetical protein
MSQLFNSSAKGPASPHGSDQVVDTIWEISKKFCRKSGVTFVIVGIMMLIRPEGACLYNDLLSHLASLHRARALPVAFDENEIGAHRFHGAKFVSRGVTVDDGRELVSPLQGDESKPCSGVAGRRLDDMTTWFEFTVSFRRSDHFTRHANFAGTRGIELFQLQKEARTVPQADELQYWCVTDQISAGCGDTFERLAVENVHWSILQVNLSPS